MADPAPNLFPNVSRKPGLQIWTINNMEMVPVPPQGYGNFFEGDCYLVLYQRSAGGAADIHYWIGGSSSQDEQGAAAILVTQLDESLGGSPVQHRQVQGAESPSFRSYFKNGLIYKKGGVASGFQHVETNCYSVLRLLRVKGRKNVTATEVDVSWNSFNKGDIFLLDMGKNIIQWNGPQSNRREKLKAVLLAQDIRDRERGGRAQINVVEGSDEEDSPELMKTMMAVLGQRTGQMKDAVPDDSRNKAQHQSVKLYHVTDNSGKLVVQEVASQPLTQDLLHSTDCYLVDQGGSSLLVWKGRQASPVERRSALSSAVGFIKAKSYPATTNVEVMSEGAESAIFKHLFQSWRETNQTMGLGSTYSKGRIAKVEQVKFNVMELHARPELAAQQRMVDDASGDVKIWRIENVELAEVKPSSYGQFYGGDCYLVLYSYRMSSRQHYILYMWQGRHATRDEVTACAFQAVNVDNSLQGAAVQVRVVMGKEPRHFLAIFKGKLILFEGGTGRPGVAPPSTDTRLFQVRGTSELNTKATEVPARASSLNTNDVFLLKTPATSYLWYGKGCSGDERLMGRAMSDVLSKEDKQVVMEDQEPAEFWVALGGKAPYARDKRLQKEVPLHAPRLFECSNQTGRFQMEEVNDFTQTDLDEEDVMLLDTWEEVFLWIGSSANQHETQEAVNSALDYLRTHPAGRDLDTPLISVKQGYEPPTFTGWFNAWDPHKWSGGNSYEQMKKELSDAGSPSVITVDLNKANLSKNPVGFTNGNGGSSYSAQGGPVGTPPGYMTQGGRLSPRASSPANPSSPSSQRAKSSLSMNLSPGSRPGSVYGTGAVSGYGSGQGSGYGTRVVSGSGQGSGVVAGYGLAQGSELGSGYGSGSVSGQVSGQGSGNMSGQGSGYRTEVSSGFSSGNGSGIGSEIGSGTGPGYGSGPGNGSGPGFGSGAGTGPGYGSGVVSGNRSGSDAPQSPTSAGSTMFSCYSRGSNWDPQAEESSGVSQHHMAPEHLINRQPEEMPNGVDPRQKEMYLSDVDFENLLGTNRADFLRLPAWRQSDLKKKAGLV
ncbi:villin-1 isoform X1 [Gadus chalcogrammus]|uniref:villin-1 isoform X1 n=1 Tax=Gadus chalcogrammus TaxID=1042646 RepID=UPI0024C47A37|nr:villin-1 isoform X1 [Gadus chalcogrammus]XP_056439824.1 villin-1 isoform X1 [Gadus chalcogrammus]